MRVTVLMLLGLLMSGVGFDGANLCGVILGRFNSDTHSKFWLKISHESCKIFSACPCSCCEEV